VSASQLCAHRSGERGRDAALARDLLNKVVVAEEQGFIEMNNTKHPPTGLVDWVEFCWLLLTNPTFRASHDKRKAYFEHRLAVQYNTPFC
jgi:hypothetical protein